MAYDYPEPLGDRIPPARVQAEALGPDSVVKEAERKIADYGASAMQPKAPAYAPQADESLELLMARGEEEDIY